MRGARLSSRGVLKTIKLGTLLFLHVTPSNFAKRSVFLFFEITKQCVFVRSFRESHTDNCGKIGKELPECTGWCTLRRPCIKCRGPTVSLRAHYVSCWGSLIVWTARGPWKFCCCFWSHSLKEYERVRYLSMKDLNVGTNWNRIESAKNDWFWKTYSEF